MNKSLLAIAITNLILLSSVLFNETVSARNLIHDTILGTGVLLVNLGTPDAATRPALRRYLSEFLSDPRVIEVPKWIWWFVLHGVILNTRPGKSAKECRGAKLLNKLNNYY